jgi:hypothetical protein
MVHYSRFLLLFFIILGQVSAQDERYYRKIFSKDYLGPNWEQAESGPTQFTVRGAFYQLDLNDDKIEEVIEPQKRDGVDWIEIRNSSNSKIFEAKLPAMGSLSYLYKIKLVYISKNVRALILFLDEGVTVGRRFESTARFFVLSYENNDLSKISFSMGPHFFQEKEYQREVYWRRDYNVNILDLDNDGTREIAVQYNHIQRIMKYKGRGDWENI